MSSNLLSRARSVQYATASIKTTGIRLSRNVVWRAIPSVISPTHRSQTRFTSATSSTELGRQDVTNSPPAPAKPWPTPKLDKTLDTVLFPQYKQSIAEMHDITNELKQLFKRHRVLKATLKQDEFKPIYERYHSGVSSSVPVNVIDNLVHVWEKPVPNIWLRDNCQCSSCVHIETKQRLLDTFKIPRDISIKSSDAQETGIAIQWSDDHESFYGKDFLRRAHETLTYRSFVRQGVASTNTWDSTIASNPPILQYPGDSRYLLFERDVTKNLRRYGFCYVDNTPFSDPNTTKELLERISFIRPTHYGGFYDFTADLASADTAYTNIALEAHTDTTYFSDPAGLQAFHLLSHTEGEGGASLLVDGFNIAQQLFNEDRGAYNTLATVNVNCHASGNDGISIQPYRGFPVLQHDPTTSHLLQVRWNSSDRASIELPLDGVEEWYDAARKWDALVKKKENEYWEQLKPGRVLIFDNWRVMHGRSAFTGKRRICGAYINRDDWISKYKMLQYGREKVLDHLATG